MAAKRSGLLFAPRRKRHPGRLTAVLLFLFVLGILFSLNMVNNRYVQLVRERVNIAGMDAALDGFTILHISDLDGQEFGEKQENLYQQIRLERFHAVCLTGDMTDGESGAQALLDLLDRLPGDVPVFFVAGDEDPEPLNGRDLSKGVKADFIALAEEKGAVYLDSPRLVEHAGRRIWFSPASLYMTDLKSASFALNQRKDELTAAAARSPLASADEAALRAVNYQLETLALTENAKKEMKPDDVYVLLSHFPLDSEEVSGLQEGERQERHAINFPGRVSLILAGHWNNGQWRLPVIGPVYLPKTGRGLGDWMPGGREVAGQSAVHGIPQYTSPGLGTSVAYPRWMPMRLLNRPQITLLELTNRII